MLLYIISMWGVLVLNMICDISPSVTSLKYTLINIVTVQWSRYVHPAHQHQSFEEQRLLFTIGSSPTRYFASKHPHNSRTDSLFFF